MSRKFAKKQPKDGDVVIHCGHLNHRQHHFYFMSQGADLMRPDGSLLTSNWICICDDCNRAAGGDPERFKIRGDCIWNGNEPAIYEEDK